MKKITIVLIIFATFLVASPAGAYTVLQGDTLTKIAKANSLTLNEITTANPQIHNLDLIYVGQTVNIVKPNERTNEKNEHTVQEKQTSVQAVKTIKTETTSRESTSPVAGTAASLTEEEIDLLARLVRSEANTEPFEGKVAVAEVVLNRMESTQYPDSISGVIYQSGQFQPVSNGEINKPANEESVKAVHAALSDGQDISGDSLFFYNPDIATNRWLDTRETTVVIGDHVFKR
ncbi:cell wall hydrolase [Niallia sp. Krafla_26]|uniref:cell wall hydrolase n=1 Tax=Niallia sp. Krafla_26 TaxID=3064703 RepID=UPI003D16EEA8